MKTNETKIQNLGVESDINWDSYIDNLYESFPKGGLDGILPPHFMRATYPKIGARIVYSDSGESEFWGLLMPTQDEFGSEWVLRNFWKGAGETERGKLIPLLQESLRQNNISHVSWYEFEKEKHQNFKGRIIESRDGLIYMEPSLEFALQAQDLQRRVWNVSDLSFLYPHDLYSPNSGLASRLVATAENRAIGFLFGFYARGKQWFGLKEGFQTGQWQESQLMGIDNDFRRKGIARHLKLLQRDLSLRDGIKIIHWTFDPLQAGNAELNLNSLGGLAVQHYKDYYAFRNDLNRVSASRIGISWLLDSQRVREYAQSNGARPDFKTLSEDSATEIITPVVANSNSFQVFNIENWTPKGDTILLEIPIDWNGVQRDNLDLAEAWRNTTDAIFSKMLPKYDQKYAISGLVRDSSGNKAYLVIQKLSEKMGI